jgi:hypothetical protein
MTLGQLGRGRSRAPQTTRARAQSFRPAPDHISSCASAELIRAEPIWFRHRAA